MAKSCTDRPDWESLRQGAGQFRCGPTQGVPQQCAEVCRNSGGCRSAHTDELLFSRSQVADETDSLRQLRAISVRVRCQRCSRDSL
jgi:hypothetical protein